MIERVVEIKNKLGLHARAAAKLVHTAARFKSDIKIRKGDEEVDGKSILGILLLLWRRGEDCAQGDAQHGPAAAHADRPRSAPPGSAPWRAAAATARLRAA